MTSNRLPGTDTPGRDAGLLSPVWAGHGEELSDEAWVAAMLQVEVALARAQARLGVVPEWAVAPIEAAVRSRPVDVARLARDARGSANPVVALVRSLTDAVAGIDPAAAEFVHRGGTVEWLDPRICLPRNTEPPLPGSGAHSPEPPVPLEPRR